VTSLSSHRHCDGAIFTQIVKEASERMLTRDVKFKIVNLVD
jgi:hypothetical protein